MNRRPCQFCGLIHSGKPSRLTATDVEMIRQARRYGWSIRKISAAFGLRKSSAYDIVRGLVPACLRASEAA